MMAAPHPLPDSISVSPPRAAARLCMLARPLPLSIALEPLAVVAHFQNYERSFNSQFYVDPGAPGVADSIVNTLLENQVDFPPRIRAKRRYLERRLTANTPSISIKTIPEISNPVKRGNVVSNLNSTV